MTQGGRRKRRAAFRRASQPRSLILVALTFVDATPRMALDAEFTEQPRTEQRAPSACGAEAVARAQREVNRSRQPSPSAFS